MPELAAMNTTRLMVIDEIGGSIDTRSLPTVFRSVAELNTGVVHISLVAMCTVFATQASLVICSDIQSTFQGAHLHHLCELSMSPAAAWQLQGELLLLCKAMEYL